MSPTAYWLLMAGMAISATVIWLHCWRGAPPLNFALAALMVVIAVGAASIGVVAFLYFAFGWLHPLVALPLTLGAFNGLGLIRWALILRGRPPTPYPPPSR